MSTLFTEPSSATPTPSTPNPTIRFNRSEVIADGSCEWTEWKCPLELGRRIEVSVVRYPGEEARVDAYIDPQHSLPVDVARRAAAVLLAACDLADRINRGEEA